MNPNTGNLRFLPLVYFLPADLIVQCPTLHSLPDNIREIVESEKWLAVVESDQFLNEIMNAMALLAFPHFGFSGWKEHYTADFPPWKLSYSLSLWADLLDKEIGLNLFTLSKFPKIAVFKPEYIKAIMERVVKRAIVEQNWQPILDIVREIPCEEDFEKRNTNAYKMFLRKWYHTRAKIEMLSLEKCMSDPKHRIHKIIVSPVDIAGDSESEDYVERFKARLSEKDKEILAMRCNVFLSSKKWSTRNNLKTVHFF